MGSFFLGQIFLDLGDAAQAEHWFERARELVPPGSPWSEMFMEPLFMYRREEAKALDIARSTMAFCRICVFTLAHLRNHDLRTGHYDDARARYARAFPDLLIAGEPTVNEGNLEPAIDLASVLIKTGEQERADLLLDRALMILPTIPRLGMDGYGISDVRIYALQGNTEAALASLRQAIDQGWRGTWWFYLGHDISLESIRDEPEYQSMVEEIESDMAAQLERVRAMEANGELEPIPDIGFNSTSSDDLRQ
jgi:tetratricopeptide (TPR) repeat protein